MPAGVRCREITPADLGDVTQLLHRGFPERAYELFATALARLTAHATPPGCPKYGYLLETGGTLVGAILVIFTTVPAGDTTVVRGNVSSWYVEPAYRAYASMLTSRALAPKTVTFLNLSPAPHTWPILEAQGYQTLCTGQFAALAMFGPRVPGARITAVGETTPLGADLSPYEARVLRDHASYGCLSLTCRSEGRTYPFVFTPRSVIRWKRVPLPFVQLAYCRELGDFARFAGPLGRVLARRGLGLVFINASGAMPGLPGKFVDWGPKFYRGPAPPHLGDIAYTERVMFDI